MCHEGECRCKSNYELFQRQCIPSQGCLHDGHCIREHTVCKNEKCTCMVNYSWNTRAGSCVLVQKTLTDQQPTVASSTAEESTKTPTVASSTAEVSTKAIPTSAVDASSSPKEESTSKVSTKAIPTSAVDASSSPKITATEEDTRTSTEKDHFSKVWTTSENSEKKALNEDKKETISPGMMVMGYGKGDVEVSVQV